MASVIIRTEPSEPDTEDANFMRAFAEYRSGGTLSTEFRGQAGGIVIPEMIYRADPLLTTTNANIINKTVGSINLKLTPARQFMNDLGITRYENLSSNFVLPSASQVTADFVSENADVSTGSFAPANITLAPRALGVTQSHTAEFSTTTNPDILSASMQAMFNSLDYRIAQDVFAQIMVDAPARVQSHVGGTLSQASFLAMEASLGFGPNKFVTTNSIKGYLKAMEVGTGIRSLWGVDNTVEGYNAYSELVVPADKMFMGNFADAAVGIFGAPELILDPYTSAKSRKVLATLNVLCDTGYANPEGIVWRTDASVY
jgi:hypothetical protein